MKTNTLDEEIEFIDSSYIYFFRYFLFFLLLDLFLPFIYDPFSIFGDYFIFDKSSFEIADYYLIIIFLIFIYIVYYYDTESLSAYTKAFSIYLIFFDWIIDELILSFFFLDISSIIFMVFFIEEYLFFFEDDNSEEEEDDDN